jgi:hypothetical protein
MVRLLLGNFRAATILSNRISVFSSMVIATLVVLVACLRSGITVNRTVRIVNVERQRLLSGPIAHCLIYIPLENRVKTDNN